MKSLAVEKLVVKLVVVPAENDCKVDKPWAGTLDAKGTSLWRERLPMLAEVAG